MTEIIRISDTVAAMAIEAEPGSQNGFLRIFEYHIAGGAVVKDPFGGSIILESSEIVALAALAQEQS